MKSYQKIIVALVAGAAVGGAAIQSIHAQAKTAYVIVAIRSVVDADNYKTVTEKAPAVVAAAGGRLVVATKRNNEPRRKTASAFCAYRLRQRRKGTSLVMTRRR